MTWDSRVGGCPGSTQEKRGKEREKERDEDSNCPTAQTEAETNEPEDATQARGMQNAAEGERTRQKAREGERRREVVARRQ